MNALKRPEGTVVSLNEVRKTADEPHSAPALKSGYLEAWHEAQTNPQAAARETSRVQEQNAALRRALEDIRPTMGERALYYVAVFGIVAVLLAWAGVLAMKGL